MKYAVTAATDRFKHPIIASLLISALVFFLIGGIFETVAVPGVPPIAAAFFGIYGVLATALGLFGYGTLYLARFVSVLGDRSAPHNA